MLLVFLAAVAAVLFIACVNVVNLVLTRATRREHEHVVRGALGARPARLIQQLLTESTLLCLLGGALGVLLALFLTDALVAMSPASIPRKEQIAVDGGVLGFTLALTVVVGLATGLTPALHASRADLVSGLNVASRGSGGSVQSARLHDGFVVAQLAVTLTLLICCGLLIRSLVGLLELETGVDPKNVLVFDTSLPETRYRSFDERRLFYDEMRERLRALPGVRTAALAVYFPASGWFHTNSFEVEGHVPAPGEELVAEVKQVTPDYFATLGIALIDGRVFDDHDGVSGPEVIVISESVARQYWQQGSAVGGRIRFRDKWLSVVGVVSDVRYRGELRDLPQLYRPYAAGSFAWSVDGLLRVEGRPAQYALSVRRVIASLDPNVVVSDLLPFEDVLRTSVSEPRFRTLMLGAFGLASVPLSVVGVYGVMAYAVARRTREFGIRKALGSGQVRTMRHIAARGLTLTGVGVVLGIGGAYAASGVLESYLFNLDAHDPTTFAIGTVVLATASMLACSIPAYRATRVDPLVALRVE